nr:MBOAT family protein [Hyphomonas sp. Mor2]
MLFVELRFFAFFAVVFGIYWSLKSNSSRKLLLTLASYVFYAAWDWRFLGLIWLITIICYVVGLNVGEAPGRSRRTQNRWLAFGVVSSLLVLAVFKYFNFFTGSFADVAQLVGLPVNTVTLQLVLPVGISFYTFQSISYIVDIRRGDVGVRKSFQDVCFYIAFFPQLVAGPIVRAADFLPQIERKRVWNSVNVRYCLILFMIGMFKKAGISDNIAPYVDMVFSDHAAYTGPTIVGGVLLYGVQIYCDFSGYSDMAIACAGLLGFVFPQNFNSPYLASNIQVFWRRWHISLSSWLRDYLYIPLGGSRVGEVHHKVNLMTTMLLGGLWHGASYNFIIWGGLHGTAQIVENYWRRFVKFEVAGMKTAFILLSTLITYWWVNLAWIFFRAPDFEAAFGMTLAYFTWSSAGDQVLPIALWPLLFTLGALHYVSHKIGMLERLSTLSDLRFAAAAGALAALVITLFPLGYRPFVYFQF